jgi:DnaJ-class molecular chaperone
MARSYYEVMMIGTTADRELLTVVYRHLAKRYHPDKDSSPRAAARMAELNEAYATLSDRAKRARYDESIGLRANDAATTSPDEMPPRDVSGGFEPDFGDAGPPPSNPMPKGRALTFGRYRGWTLNQVGRYDRDYLEWLSRTTMGRTYRQELDELLRPGR